METKTNVVRKCLVCRIPALETHARCEKCLVKSRGYTSKFQKKNRSNGLCACGKVAITNSSCEKCWFSRMAKNRTGSRSNAHLIKSIFEQQNGLCAYTGEKLIIGINASLDHKMPISKGGGKYDKDNLQWVCLRINWMKTDFSHSEFLAMCLSIARHRKVLATN